MEEDDDLAAAAAREQRVTAVRRAFPGASTLHITASSTRDYPASYTQVGSSNIFCLLQTIQLQLAASAVRAVDLGTVAAIVDGLITQLWPAAAVLQLLSVLQQC
jgi:hypothetical protein